LHARRSTANLIKRPQGTSFAHMPVECHQYPCRSDNYGVLVRDTATGKTALIDVPDEMATREAIEDTGWAPTHIFLTHHHHDHIDGVGGIRSSYDVEVVGNEADAHRLPRLDSAGASR
jgi:hydroxyacylglutathione hydrolase